MTGKVWAVSGWGSACRNKPFSMTPYKPGRKDVSAGADGEELRSSRLIFVFDISGSQMSLEACSYLLDSNQNAVSLLMWHLLYKFNVCNIAQFPQARYLTSPRSQSHPPRKYIKWNVTAPEVLGEDTLSPWRIHGNLQHSLGRESEHMGSNKPLLESWFLFIFPLSPIFLLKSFKKNNFHCSWQSRKAI